MSLSLSFAGCGTLTLPNGNVSYSNAQLVGSVATYSCNAYEGYVLPEGTVATRTCTVSGWTGNNLTCQCKIASGSEFSCNLLYHSCSA